MPLFAGVAAGRVQDEALRAFEAALAAGQARYVRDVWFADQHLRLELAGDAALDVLMPPFTPAPFLHTEPHRAREPDLTLRIWDASASPSAYLPSPGPQATECLEPRRPWHDAAVSGRAATGDPLSGHADGHAPHQVFWERYWTFGFDLAEKTGFFHCPSLRELPDWSLAHPCLKLLQPWLRARGIVVLHAGAVGVEGRCALIAGPSGAGKSTLSIAARAAGLDYLGDDYVGLRMPPDPAIPPRAFGLYRVAKLVPEHMRAFLPMVEAHRIATPGIVMSSPEPKTRLLLDITAPDGLDVAAIVAPAITSLAGPRTELSPISAAAALNALAPSTLLQLSSDPDDFAQMASLVRRVPAHRLAVGPDLAPAIAALRSLTEAAT